MEKIMIAFIILFVIAIGSMIHVAVRNTEICETKGGMLVKTNEGWICTKIERIK